jgi:hypothetical protein
MKNIGSEIFILAQPFYLRPSIPVEDIALFVLEIPGNDNKDVPFTDPDFLFYLALDPPHASNAIETPDTDMVCTHHQFSAPELLTVPFLGEFYPYDLLARRILRFFLFQCYSSCSFTNTCSIFGAGENKLFPDDSLPADPYRWQAVRPNRPAFTTQPDNLLVHKIDIAGQHRTPDRRGQFPFFHPERV